MSYVYTAGGKALFVGHPSTVFEPRILTQKLSPASFRQHNLPIPLPRPPSHLLPRVSVALALALISRFQVHPEERGVNVVLQYLLKVFVNILLPYLGRSRELGRPLRLALGLVGVPQHYVLCPGRIFKDSGCPDIELGLSPVTVRALGRLYLNPVHRQIIEEGHLTLFFRSRLH